MSEAKRRRSGGTKGMLTPTEVEQLRKLEMLTPLELEELRRVGKEQSDYFAKAFADPKNRILTRQQS